MVFGNIVIKNKSLFISDIDLRQVVLLISNAWNLLLFKGKIIKSGLVRYKSIITKTILIKITDTLRRIDFTENR